MITTLSPLKCQIVKVVLAWEFEEDYALREALKDVKDILTVSFERLAMIVKVIVIEEGH